MAERAVAAADALFDVPDALDDADAPRRSATPGSPAGWRSAGARTCSRARRCSCSAPPARSAASPCRRRSCLGAGRVVAAARGGERLRRLRELGADAVVDARRRGRPRRAHPRGRGRRRRRDHRQPVGRARRRRHGRAARFGRHVQVGQLAGPELELAAPAIRSKSLDVRGFMGLHPPARDPRATPTRGSASTSPAARSSSTSSASRSPTSRAPGSASATRRGREAGPHPERRSHEQRRPPPRHGPDHERRPRRPARRGRPGRRRQDRRRSARASRRRRARRRSTRPTASSCRA